jgi:hypothetical protein
MPVNDMPIAISHTNNSLDFIAALRLDVIALRARSRLGPEGHVLRPGRR